MYDDAIDPYDIGMREISRRLEAFADTRLSPSLSGTSRMRTTVMNAAHRRAALLAADRTFETAASTAATTTTVPALAAQRTLFAMPAWRRPMAALAAGALVLALVGGTASAASAGGPLYATRIWVEMANLPAGSLARADAEVTRLDARLEEAKQAYARGDGPAAEAALTAYSVILTEAVEGSAADPAASAAIEANLNRHVADLELMVASVPLTSLEALQHALASSTLVLHDLDDQMVQDRQGTQGTQGRPADDVLGPTGPTGTKPEPPAKGQDAVPGVAPEATPKPAKSEIPYTNGRANGNGGTPPGHADPKAPSHPDATPRPTDKPTAPKSGGT
jgi:hypothetical protein